MAADLSEMESRRAARSEASSSSSGSNARLVVGSDGAVVVASGAKLVAFAALDWNWRWGMVNTLTLSRWSGTERPWSGAERDRGENPKVARRIVSGHK